MAELPINEDVNLLWAPVVPQAPRSDQARPWQMTQYCQIVTPEISSVSIIISIWVIWSLNIYRFTNSKCDFSSYRNLWHFMSLIFLFLLLFLRQLCETKHETQIMSNQMSKQTFFTKYSNFGWMLMVGQHPYTNNPKIKPFKKGFVLIVYIQVNKWASFMMMEAALLASQCNVVLYLVWVWFEIDTKHQWMLFPPKWVPWHSPGSLSLASYVTNATGAVRYHGAIVRC